MITVSKVINHTFIMSYSNSVNILGTDYDIDTTTSINLSKRNLTSIPDCISLLVNLRVLYLADNAISSLVNLKMLNLNDNRHICS